MNETRRETRGDLILGGVIAGILGGAVLALIMIFPAAGNLQATWPSLKVASYPVMGPQVFQPGFHPWSMALGTLLHFAIAIAWALLFTWVTRRWSKPAVIGGGLLYGALVWAVMYFGVIPLVGAVALLHRVPYVIGLVQHLAFGLAVGLTLALLEPHRWRQRSLEEAGAA